MRGGRVTWFKLECSILSDPKLELLPGNAYKAWIRGVAYCAQHLTDGHLDETAVKMLRIPKTSIDRLVHDGLWQPDPLGGWVIHGYLNHQRSKDQVRAEREAARRRQRKHRGLTRWPSR